MVKKISYIITIVNLLFQIFYSIFGIYTQTEIRDLGIAWMLYIFRPEYLIISGVLSCVCVIVLITVITNERTISCFLFNMVALMFNLEYIVFYIALLMRQ